MTPDLFSRRGPAAFPEPRAFQVTAHDRLRDGIRAGHLRQLLVAPTGAGKTYLGLRVINEALQKGRRALFVCDRTALINQTSQRADQYGLTDHGIVQANHKRRDNSLPFQIASVQTLSARGYWPDADVIVVDEAHTQYKTTREQLQATQAAVVGLTATPCSKGLGWSYSHVVNAATMHELTEVGVLVPLRIYSCTTPDMKGAETSGGEWTDRAAGERSAKIIGDVVAEWQRYGEGRKSIAFGASIAYCTELAQRFNEAGIRAETFTSETPDDERAALLQEFRKPDSSIRVLISVEALAKGFDVEDIGCVIDARPLRKSLSTAIQMWGRGLRSSPDTGKTNCLARGTLVLTDRGEVEIQHVTLDHKVWDGENFVSHGGAICRGVQGVIEYDGLVATLDHEVWTHDGWTRIEAAARRRLRIARTGLAGQPVRLSDCDLKEHAGQFEQPASGGAVQSLWRRALGLVRQHAQAAGYGSLPALQRSQAGAGAALALPTLPVAVAALHESERFVVRALRGAWHRVSVRFGQRGGSLGGAEFRCAGPRDAVGPQGEQRALRAGQSSLDHAGRQPEQHAGVWWTRALHHISQVFSWGPLRRCDADSNASNYDADRDRRAVEGALPQAQREVWDVLNAGPLQRFTANGRLVHNCLLLDHSGNILRFRADFEDVFFNGFGSLDDSEKLDKAVREDDEHAGSKCPKCGFSPFCKHCMACGYEKVAQAMVDEAPGEMREIRIGKSVIASDKRDLWQQLCGYVTEMGNKPGRAWHLYREIVGTPPPRGWTYESTAPAQPSRGTLNKIKSLRIAYLKGRESAELRAIT